MIEATPKTLLKGAASLYREGEKTEEFSSRSRPLTAPLSSDAAKSALKGLIQISTVVSRDEQEKVAALSVTPGKRSVKRRSVKGSSCFDMDTFNNILLFINFVLISAVGMAFYMLYTVNS